MSEVEGGGGDQLSKVRAGGSRAGAALPSTPVRQCTICQTIEARQSLERHSAMVVLGGLTCPIIFLNHHSEGLS